MKVPKYIREKMRRCAVLNQQAAAEMQALEEWLEKNGFDIEDLRDGSGCSLEELEYGNDIADELCDRIEQEADK